MIWYILIFNVLYHSVLSTAATSANDQCAPGPATYEADTQIFNFCGCETPSSPPTKEMDTYKVVKTSMNWNKARNACIEQGGHLAVITSEEEEKILQKLRVESKVPEEGVWLGLHDQFEEGDWTTVLDQPLKKIGYVHWTKKWPNLPDNGNGREGGQNCAQLLESGMDDFHCLSKRPFICKIPAGLN